MSFAYLPWYTGDYRRDTSDLTLVEHGIYLLLLAHCWDSRGPVPPDEARAARIVGASSDDERLAVKNVLKRFFLRHDDGWYNPRMEKEIARCNAISGARSEAGKRGAESTWDKRQGNSPASAMANGKQLLRQVPLSPSPTLSPALSPSPKVKNTMSSSQANIDDARQLLEFLNLKAGRFFRPTAKTLEPIVARLKEGNSVSDCKAVIARRCRAWKDDPAMSQFLRPQTLFGAQKFAQYIGEVPPDEEHHADQDLP